MNCGMRLSELVSINYSDIKPDNTIIITGKGNKQRTVYLNDACVSAIKDYMKVRPVDGVKDKEALFLSNRKTRISPKTVQHIVDEYLEKSGLSGQGFSTHKLRHTAATLMYQYGHVDVLQLKRFSAMRIWQRLKFILMLSTNNCAVPLIPTRLIKSKSTAKSLNLILAKIKS